MAPCLIPLFTAKDLEKLPCHFIWANDLPYQSYSILTVKKPLNYKRVKVEKDRTENVLGFWPKMKTAPKMKFHE